MRFRLALFVLFVRPFFQKYTKPTQDWLALFFLVAFLVIFPGDLSIRHGLRNDAVGLDEAFLGPGGVCRAGRGQTDGLDAGLRLAQLFVVLVRGRAGAEDRAHSGLGDEPGQIVWHRVADGSVARAADVTGGQGVPHGDVVAERQAALVLDGLRRRFAKYGRQDRPEAVLRVAIEKRLLTRFGARDGTQDERARIGRKERREIVCDMGIFHHISSSMTCKMHGRPKAGRNRRAVLTA